VGKLPGGKSPRRGNFRGREALGGEPSGREQGWKLLGGNGPSTMCIHELKIYHV